MRVLGQILAAFLLAVLWLPAFQHLTGCWDFRPLSGDIPAPPPPTCSVSAFLDGSFQGAAAPWLRARVGFQPALVRTYNEFQYRAFNVARANGVQIGRDPATGNPVLFESAYVACMRGLDGVRAAEIDAAADRLAAVAGDLAFRGIPLLTVIAPNKARFLPECLPKGPPLAEVTTYDRWRRALRARGLPFLDADSLLRAWRPESPHPLFSPTGIHWTRYGAMRFAPELLDAYSSVAQRPMPQFALLDAAVPGEARWSDDDIELGMNLWTDLPDGPLAYPAYDWQPVGNTPAPRVLVSGDSFYWALFNFGCSKEGFGNGPFAFYHQAVYPASFKERTEDVDILGAEGVVLLFTEATFRKSLYPFLADAEAELGLSPIPVQRR